MPLTAASRIVATDPKLKPLAEILSDEILADHASSSWSRPRARPSRATSCSRSTRSSAPTPTSSTVQNREVKKVRDYAHTINVSDKAVVEGWDYRAVCEGTATLLAGPEDQRRQGSAAEDGDQGLAVCRLTRAS